MSIFFKDEDEKKKYLEGLKVKQDENIKQLNQERNEAIKNVQWKSGGSDDEQNPFLSFLANQFTPTTLLPIVNKTLDDPDVWTARNLQASGKSTEEIKQYLDNKKQQQQNQSTWNKVQEQANQAQQQANQVQQKVYTAEDLKNAGIALPTMNMQKPEATTNPTENMARIRQQNLETAQQNTKEFVEGLKDTSKVLKPEEVANGEELNLKAYEKAEEWMNKIKQGDKTSWKGEYYGSAVPGGAMQQVGGWIYYPMQLYAEVQDLFGNYEGSKNTRREAKSMKDKADRPAKSREYLRQMLKKEGMEDFLSELDYYVSSGLQTGSAMGFSALVGQGTGINSSALMGVSAGGNAFETRAEKTNNENFIGNTVASTMEGIWNYIWEEATGGNILTQKTGLNKAGEVVVKNTGWFDKYFFNGIKKLGVKNPVALKAINKSWQFLGEMVEEWGTDISTALTNKIVLNEDTYKDLNDLFAKEGETGKQTFISTVMLNLLGMGGSSTKDIAKQYNLNESTVEDVQKQVQNYMKENNMELTKENVNEITNKYLQEAGINEDLGKITEEAEKEPLSNTLAKEQEQRFEYQQSDNEKIDNLRKQASEILNNSEATHNFIDVLEKIVSDKNYNIVLNNQLTDEKGNIANGRIKTLDNGEVEITINPNSNRAGEFILTHEITHAIATDEMRKLVQNYMQKDPKFSEAVKSLQQTYNTNEISDEVLSDVSGQLFGNQEFITQLSVEKPNLFKRIYNKIIELANKITGNSNEALFIRDLKNKWEQAYRNNYNNSTDTQYLLAGQNAQLSNKTTLQQAQLLEQQGKTPQQIWEETGWIKKDDGKWRFELDDSKYNVKYEPFELSKDYKLSDILENAEELFNNYPELANLKVRFENETTEKALKTDDNSTIEGGYNPSTNEFLFNKDAIKDTESFKEAVLHEIQHAIQVKEGFDGGANPLAIENAREKIPDMLQRKEQLGKELASNQNKLQETNNESKIAYLKDQTERIKKSITALDKTLDVLMKETDNDTIYENTSGEQEARNIEERSNLSKEERAKTLPFVSDENTIPDLIRLKNENTISIKDGNEHPMVFKKEEAPKRYTAVLDADEEAIQGAYQVSNKKDGVVLDYKNPADITVLDKIQNDIVELAKEKHTSILGLTDEDFNSIYQKYGLTEEGYEKLSNIRDWLEGLSEDVTVADMVKSLADDDIFTDENGNKYDVIIPDKNSAYVIDDTIIKNSLDKSASVDNRGNKVNKGLQKFLEKSAVKNEDGQPILVYNTMTQRGSQFNEYNPVGTPGYRFGNQVVMYTTDSQEMSGSYASGNYKTADTTKLNSYEEAQQYVKEYNDNQEESLNSYKLTKNEDGTYTLQKETNAEIEDFINNLNKDQIQDLKDNIYEDKDFAGTPYEYAFSWDKFLPSTNEKYQKLVDKYIGTPKLAEIQHALAERLYNGSLTQPITYKNTEEMLQNIKSDIITQSGNSLENRYQYAGYMDIQNPYVIDAGGKNWNTVQYMDTVASEGLINLDQKSKDNLKKLAEKSKKLYYEAKDNRANIRELLFFADTEKGIDQKTTNFIRQMLNENKSKEVMQFLNAKTDSFKNWDANSKSLYLMEDAGLIDDAGAYYSEWEKTKKAQAYLKEKLQQEVKLFVYNKNLGTLENIIKDYNKAIDKAEKYKEPSSYFSQELIKDEAKYKDISNDYINAMEKTRYGDEKMFNAEKAQQLFVSAENNFDEDQIRKNYAKGRATNDIVFDAMNINNKLIGNADGHTAEEIRNAGGYDGVIIRNTVDYGGYSGTYAPHDLFIAFDSSQFKYADNENPTNSKDFRYSKENTNWKDYLENKFKATGTRTNLEDVRIPVNNKTETTAPVSKEVSQKQTSKTSQILDRAKKYLNADIAKELTPELFNGLPEAELKQGLIDTYKTQLDEELAEGNYKTDKNKSRTYMQYKNKKTNYNEKILNNALDTVKANRNGKRTMNQWLDVAKQIGINSADLTPAQLQDLAYGSWFDLKPNTKDSRTYYDNVAKTNLPYKEFKADNWINTIYQNAKQVKMQEFTQALNKQEVKAPVKVAKKVPVKQDTVTTQKQDNSLDSLTKIEEPKEAVMPVKNKTAEETKIAKVLSQPVEKQNSPQRLWALLKANLVDKGAVFEDISLKTKNRELQAKWDATLSSDSNAQYAIAKARYNFDNGKKTQISKGLTDIIDSVGNKVDDFQNYMYHQLNVDRMTLEDRYGTKNKPVFGDNIGAEYSKAKIAEYEKNNPEFKEYAQDVYDYLDANKKVLVDNGIISQELSDKFKEMYPHYVPIARVDKNNQSIAVPLDTKRTGVNSPIKKAKGGSQDIQPLFQTIADKTFQTYKASARNDFGLELKNSLAKLNMLNQSNENVDIDTIIDTMNDETQSGLTEGTATTNPTFTVFENGNKITYDINQDMYDALKPKSELLKKLDNTKFFKGMKKISNFRRGILTEYNPVFSLTNAIKDAQDVLINSQHATKTYSKFPEAYAQILKKGYWYQEYMQNGGEQNSYFKDGDFEVKDNTVKGKVKSLVKMPLEGISRVNNVIEMAPRLAEYIASREAGRSVKTSMLDASRVTTNFKAGGDFTKFLNRNGATFLNASVQGMAQNIRNIKEANAKGLKGYATLAGKAVVAGIPALILNNLVWRDDDDYEDLQDYVKDNYYIIAKVGDHQFLRIPKGRTVSVIQKIVSNADEFINNKNQLNVDEYAKAFWQDLSEDFSLAMNNLAPNNPLENNIASPVVQAVTNKTWYGSDLVPSRLQDKPANEQYDETTSEVSKNISNMLNSIGINSNPMAINYLLDQYGGGVADILLPMGTPQAENDVLEDKFTTNSIMKARYAGEFFSKYDELTTNSKASTASDDDTIKYKYFSSVRGELSKLYQQEREIQNSNKTDEVKKKEIEKVQKQINDKAKKALEEVKKVKSSDYTASVGGVDFIKVKNAKTGEYEWNKVSDKEKIDGLSLTTYANYKNKLSDELIKQRNNGTLKETQQLKNKDKMQIIKNSNYSNSEKKALYESETDDDFYKSALKDSININEYLDYKSQTFTADKDQYGQTVNGTAKTKTVNYINSNITGYYNKLLLMAKEYKIQDGEEKQKLVQWINKQPNKMEIYKQLSNNFIVSNGKVYYK